MGLFKKIGEAVAAAVNTAVAIPKKGGNALHDLAEGYKSKRPKKAQDDPTTSYQKEKSAAPCTHDPQDDCHASPGHG